MMDHFSYIIILMILNVHSWGWGGGVLGCFFRSQFLILWE